MPYPYLFPQQYQTEPGLPSWIVETGPQPVTAHNVMLIRNTSSDQLMLVENLYARVSNATDLAGEVSIQASALGTSAGVVTPTWHIHGKNLANADTAFPGKAYYGTSAAGTGISSSGPLTPSAFNEQLAAGVGDTIAQNIAVAPGYALAVRATPTAKGDVTVRARCTFLGPGLW